MYPEHALGVLFEFEPCAAVGDDGGAEHLLARLVHFLCVVHAGRTDELRYYYALGAVDDERAGIGHEGEFAHEYVLVDDFVLDLVYQPDLYVHGKRVGGVAVAALFFVVLGFVVKPVVEEIELVVVGIVGYRRKIFKYFAYALVDEGIVARLLNFNEVGNVDDFVDLAEFAPFRLAILVNG